MHSQQTRSRTWTEWEETFSRWSAPPGATEKAKCENAESMVRKAIAASDKLNRRDISVFPQGSYRNRTNISAESDVDICICCKDSMFFDLPANMKATQFGISTPAEYQYSVFKNEVQEALESYFGASAIERGNKAFDVHENTYHVAADVVPTFEYHRYSTDGSSIVGTSLQPDEGARIINWPEQNYTNGVLKHTLTNKRFKKVVRILKNLKVEMMENGYSTTADVPSYLIECLVWNVPNGNFGHDKFTGDVRSSLAFLCSKTRESSSCSEWGEVNELKYLFRQAQPWTMEQANSFLNLAWNYIGFQ